MQEVLLAVIASLTYCKVMLRLGMRFLTNDLVVTSSLEIRKTNPKMSKAENERCVYMSGCGKESCNTFSMYFFKDGVYMMSELYKSKYRTF